MKFTFYLVRNYQNWVIDLTLGNCFFKPVSSSRVRLDAPCNTFYFYL